MLKRVVLTLLQFLVFGALLVLGAFWAFVRLFYPRLAFVPVWTLHVSATHDLVANGLVFAAVLLVLTVLLQAVTRALKPWASLTVLAFVLAVVLSFAMKLGLITVGAAAS